MNRREFFRFAGVSTAAAVAPNIAVAAFRKGQISFPAATKIFVDQCNAGVFADTSAITSAFDNLYRIALNNDEEIESIIGSLKVIMHRNKITVNVRGLSDIVKEDFESRGRKYLLQPPTAPGITDEELAALADQFQERMEKS